MVDTAVGHSVLAVAVDSLDAVAVGIEQEAAVIRWAVLRAGPGWASVAVARVDPGLPERVDLGAVAGTEADVQPAGHPMLMIRRAYPPVVPPDQVGARLARLDAKNAEEGAVKPLGCRDV
jgi:hypothetical protein